MGGAAAALAAIVLGVYLHNYRNSVSGGAVTAPVLVAKNLIPKGTSGDTIASSSQCQVAQLPRSDLNNGAIRAPVILAGRVALAGIYPPHELHAGEYAAAGI